MKMTKFFAMALPVCAGALLAGCSEAAVEESIAPEPAASTHTITAVIDNDVDDTRAYVDQTDYFIKWQKGDQITFFSAGQTTPIMATLDDQYANSTTGHFTSNSEMNYGIGSCGVYPHSAANSVTRTETTTAIQTELPTTQTYHAGSFGGQQVCMTAVVTDETGTLTYQTYHSGLGIQLKGSGSGFKIKVTSEGDDNKALAGKVTINTPYAKGYPVAATTAESSKSVEFVCKGVELNQDKQMFCVALLPGKYERLTVTVTNLAGEPMITTKTLKNREFTRGKVKVMSALNVDVVNEEPNNPGNMNSWGGDGTDISVSYTNLPVKWVSDYDGWIVNCRSVYKIGGFGTAITYHHNGIMANGLLTSKNNSTGTATYFQWGRWLGFPDTCGKTYFIDGDVGGCYPENSQYLTGINVGDTKIGYIGDSKLKTSYVACYMGNNNWDRERVLKCSIVFGMVYYDSYVSNFTGDYIGDNEVCSWSNRCGNPCPDGYRIPTADELAVLIPSTGEINGSYAEVKTVKGTKYAMQWKVNTSNELEVPCVEIRSVKTSANTVDVNDPIFDSSKVISLGAYGRLDNAGDPDGSKSSYGYYWSCESETDDAGCNKGLYLQIGFSGSRATMSLMRTYRCFGQCVIPIKDDTAKATPLTPWLPVTIQHN